ncbi:hypothetical protein KO481_00740 [Nocardia sp. NEAU-G5]|uniref:Anti-sigma-M factor RsmA n=1 Tax=Nocardia albiluteola TaxID=2842303 RepID=A0ABS6ASR8_9NOCA|nr:hypothetical protein [Nocardia albiluteola]MBU3060058.1 hypothetical protein [Nocardia albiluteola]
MVASSAPKPPFSTDLLADLHANNVTPDLSEQLWPQVRSDPEALRFLRSLDDVTAELHALGQDSAVLHAMPPDVTARLDRLLDELASGTAQPPAERVATVHRLPVARAATQPPATHPLPAVDTAALEAIDPLESDEPVPAPIRIDRRRWRWLAAAAAAIALVAGTLVGVDSLRGHQAAPNALPIKQSDDVVNLSDDLPVSQLLGAMGRRDLSGPLQNPGALNGCLAAVGLDRTVLGAMNATYRSQPAVLVLLTGPNPPKITALIVGKDCGAGHPHKLVMQDIG